MEQTISENSIPNDSAETNNLQEDIQNAYQLCSQIIHNSTRMVELKKQLNNGRCSSEAQELISKLSDKGVELCSKILKLQNIKGGGSIMNNRSKDWLNMVVHANDKFIDEAREQMEILNDGRAYNPPPEDAVSKKKDKSDIGAWNDVTSSVTWKQRIQSKLFVKRNLDVHLSEKPQLKFKDAIDNSSLPFVPRITEKPNALVPLRIRMEEILDGTFMYCHPYEYEIDHFNVPDSQLSKVNPVSPPAMEDTSFVYVDDEHELNSMIEHLTAEPEIAIDLEHHEYHSFQGFTCLMQISTRTRDYVIDALALRDKLHALNNVFTDPNVVKVFHGAEYDVVWLQRDFGVYVVNMFDTYQASLVLNFKRLSLLHLLKQYCNTESDKSFQLYDWRTRPLPEEALNYARGDTHYLLYLFDVLRNQLIDAANGGSSLLRSVYTRSAAVCKKRYERVMLREDSHIQIYKLSRRSFDNRQMHALKELYRWRDTVARAEDESTAYVLPNHMMLQIADTLPREAQGILACCNPVPPLVRKHLIDVHQLIHAARNMTITASALDYQTIRSFTLQGPVTSKQPPPHDTTHYEDFRPNLPTLLDGTDVIRDTEHCTGEPKLTAFGEKDASVGTASRVKSARNVNSGMKSGLHLKDKQKQHLMFVSPYQRYKKTLVYNLEQQKQKQGTSDSTSVETKSEDTEKEVTHELDEMDEFMDTSGNIIVRKQMNKRIMKMEQEIVFPVRVQNSDFEPTQKKIKISKDAVHDVKKQTTISSDDLVNKPEGQNSAKLSEHNIEENSEPSLLMDVRNGFDASDHTKANSKQVVCKKKGKKARVGGRSEGGASTSLTTSSSLAKKLKKLNIKIVKSIQKRKLKKVKEKEEFLKKKTKK